MHALTIRTGALLVGLAALGACSHGRGAQTGAATATAQAPNAPQGGAAAPFTTGQISGTVTGIDLPGGRLAIATSNRGPVVINALPTQLAGYNLGDSVALTTHDYDGMPWLAIDGSGGQGGTGALPPEGNFSQSGQVTGYLSQVNHATGTISIRGGVLRSHPDLLINLQPGQYVAADYEVVGNVPWSQSITVQSFPAAGAGSQGQGGGGGATNRH